MMNFPDKVRVIEVGPRDGFQNLKQFIPTEVKLKEIEMLIQAGVKEIEITSFVHPKAIPQMADAAEIASDITARYGNVRIMALVPNLKGAERAMSCGLNTVAYVISASESHNLANVNRTIEQSLAELKALTDNCGQLTIRLDIATAFCCPFEGMIEEEKVFRIAQTALEWGVKEIVLCDTIGAAGPKQTETLARNFLSRYPGVSVGLHMHDTRGLGLVNALAGFEAGIKAIETSVGGLGGCPFAPGAAGNTATEDLLYMLDTCGIESGINLEKYMRAVEYARDNISSDLTGRMVKASCNMNDQDVASGRK